jgi:hypothetical protein
VRASELAPALLERATAYKPITLYRAGEFRSFTAASAPAYFKGPLSEMIFNHWFFESHMMLVFNQKVDNRLQALIHEVTHLADPAHKISQSKAWRTLANSTIRERYRLPFKLRQVPDAIAWEAGLPSSYAATNDVEALAEYCAALVLMHDKSKVNPEIKQFIQAKLLQLPSEPDQSIPDCYEAWQLVRKRDLSALRQAKQLFEKALKYDPDYLEAFWGKQFVDMRIADQATGESR